VTPASPRPAASRVNAALKLLVAVTCLALLGFVMLEVVDRLERWRRAKEIAAQNSLTPEMRMERMRQQSECSRNRRAIAAYSRGEKQDPGMPSWNDARIFVAKNCPNLR
jgi:hypothetical protein